MRPRLRILALAAPAIALALTACFGFDATMAGGPLEDGGASSGSDATFEDVQLGADGEAPSADGGKDATVTGDGGKGGSSSSSSGGSSSGGGDGGGFCNSLSQAGLVLCDDFDNVDSTDTLPGVFNTDFETWGTLNETDASYESPPNALDEKTFVLNDGGIINVALRRTAIQAPTAFPVTLTFAFALDAVQIDTTTGDAIVLGAVDFFDGANNTGNRYTLGLAINTANALPALALDEQSGFTDGGTTYTPHTLPPADAPAIGAWSNVVLTVYLTAAQSGTASVSVNGVTELQAFPLTVTIGPPLSLQVGIGTSFVTQPSPGWELYYDNVWFAIQ